MIRDLGLDEEKVNVNGGAIALGHPLSRDRAGDVATTRANTDILSSAVGDRPILERTAYPRGIREESTFCRVLENHRIGDVPSSVCVTTPTSIATPAPDRTSWRPTVDVPARSSSMAD